jgi:hypothetical protein
VRLTGVWHLVTSNLPYLPALPVVSWKAIFDVILLCAPTGGEGGARAFEGKCHRLVRLWVGRRGSCMGMYERRGALYGEARGFLCVSHCHWRGGVD